MYSLDYIPAVQPTNYANPTSPLTPPTVGIPTNASGILISPNKTPTMTLIPTAKQYASVAAGPPPAVATVTPAYHGKMPLQQTHPPPARHPHANIYHHYNSPPPLQSAAFLAVPSPSATAVVHTPPSGILKVSPTEKPLLAIDISHTVEHNALKTNTKTTNSSIGKSIPAVAAKTVVVSTDAPSPSPTTSTMNGTVTNHCVELYTS